MKLSLCIATYNEEDFIHYPLDSAYDLADEVIIVDGGSTDNTIKIAKSYGEKVKVISTENPAMFHINKQKAIEAAKGEWILLLDSDEALSGELKEQITTILKNYELRIKNKEEGEDQSVNSQVVAYWIPRKNWFLGRFLTKGGIYPDKTIRLYKNGVAKFPCKSVHENVEIKGKVGQLKHDILHFADPNFERYLTRWNRYTSMDAKILLEKHERPSFFSYFIIKPKVTFFSIYFLHKGFQDGFSGFVWAVFSSLRFLVIYIKWWQARKIRHQS